MQPTLKTALHDLCLQQVNQRIATAKEAMDAAQAAANNEGKSSAGDKYETGRAMMQLERDQHARLLAEALKLKQALDKLDVSRQHEQVQPGSLLRTDTGYFFIAVSLGKLVWEGQEYMAISPLTPLATSLIGLQQNETAVFNNKKIRILELC
ncbi:3-oxoacyl-ACP synthase [Cesiribacter sp. SM1]|uniref:3-oxoacyl-ACP synthase n=1 Tax=Cesiribacter sp. SM1 TaxID=2861196 RepID=UPI001CD2F6EB|nr:3-oxoacyl-ACP synthase [Cesiribacter sp. SM1]